MAKKPVKGLISLQIKAWQANPAPPVGPALWQYWVPIQDFCSQFNEKTKEMWADVVPVVITVYEDRTFSFITKVSPASYLIKKELKLKSGSAVPHKEKVGHLTMDQLKKIAEKKMPDLNANDIDAAMKIIAWTARASWITTDLEKKAA